MKGFLPPSGQGLWGVSFVIVLYFFSYNFSLPRPQDRADGPESERLPFPSRCQFY